MRNSIEDIMQDMAHPFYKKLQELMPEDSLEDLNKEELQCLLFIICAATSTHCTVNKETSISILKDTILYITQAMISLYAKVYGCDPKFLEETPDFDVLLMSAFLVCKLELEPTTFQFADIEQIGKSLAQLRGDSETGVDYRELEYMILDYLMIPDVIRDIIGLPAPKITTINPNSLFATARNLTQEASHDLVQHTNIIRNNVRQQRSESVSPREEQQRKRICVEETASSSMSCK